jgi:hypothetical protein
MPSAIPCLSAQGWLSTVLSYRSRKRLLASTVPLSTNSLPAIWHCRCAVDQIQRIETAASVSPYHHSFNLYPTSAEAIGATSVRPQTSPLWRWRRSVRRKIQFNSSQFSSAVVSRRPNEKGAIKIPASNPYIWFWVWITICLRWRQGSELWTANIYRTIQYTLAYQY